MNFVTMEKTSAEKEIFEFIQKELKNRSKNINIQGDTLLLTSNLLDSLFLVDLILFLETQFPEKSNLLQKAKKQDLDSINKILNYIAN